MRVKDKKAPLSAYPWSREEICKQPIFFNVWYGGPSRHRSRSTADMEDEAVSWSAAGLRVWGDLMRGGCLLTTAEFGESFGGLRRATYEELQLEFPVAWRSALFRQPFPQPQHAPDWR